VSEAGQLTNVPALDQTQIQLTETGTEHLLDGLVVICVTGHQRVAKLVGLLATAAPERKLTNFMEQCRDEYLFLVPR
jgi:hypothetical protein